MNPLSSDHRAENRLFSRSFLLLVGSSILFYSSMYVFLNYLPEFVLSLGGSQADVGLVTGAFVTSSLVMRPLVGRIIDQVGRVPVLLLGNALFVVVPLLYALPENIVGLIGVRMLHGVGLSLFTTAGLTIVTDTASSTRRGEATSFFMSAQIIAIALAPALGSLLIKDNGFPSLIPVATIVGIFSLLLALFARYPETTIIDQQGRRGMINLLRRPGIAASGVASATVGLGYATIITFLPVVAAHGVMRQASLFYFIYAVVSLIVRTPAGRLSDHVGRKQVIVPMVALSSIALLLIYWAANPLWLVIAALLYGVGFGSAYPVVGALAADHAPIASRGMIMGFYAGSFDVGLLIGSIGGGLVGEYTEARTIFAGVALMTLVGLLLFYLVGIRIEETDVIQSPR